MMQCMRDDGRLPGVDITTSVMVAMDDGSEVPMKDKYGKDLVYELAVRGQTYSINRGGGTRRRRLLQYRKSRC